VAVPSLDDDNEEDKDPELEWRAWKHALSQSLNTHHIFSFIIIPSASSCPPQKG